MGSFHSDTFSYSFQVNMFMYRQQLRYLLLLMYSLPYIMYMFFSPTAALNKPGSVITKGMGAGGRGDDNKQTNSWILNDLRRNSLLGKRKKIAKFLMRTFTYRSTFLYAGIQITPSPHPDLPPLILLVGECVWKKECNPVTTGAREGGNSSVWVLVPIQD